METGAAAVFQGKDGGQIPTLTLWVFNVATPLFSIIQRDSLGHTAEPQTDPFLRDVNTSVMYCSWQDIDQSCQHYEEYVGHIDTH